MNCAVVGLAFGDEAKGKVADVLMEHYDICVRYSGGPNAGHTVVVGHKKYKLHSLPIGIIRGKMSIIANGCVIDPDLLSQEVVNFKYLPLLISDKAHVITQDHKNKDAEDNVIGTTKRGIGPCYANKATRVGATRVKDVAEDFLIGKISPLNHGAFLLSIKDTDTGKYLRDCIKKGQNILFEGAQGIQLDVDFGTFPYVTSCGVGPAAIPQSCGLPNLYLDRIVGVTKCYMTRVGEGPLDFELKDNFGDSIREQANEYGTTTGRPRRIGIFDLDLLKRSIELTGTTDIALTMCDIPYNFTKWPYVLNKTIKQIDSWTKIDCDEFKRFINLIESELDIPVKIISFGPDREETLLL